MQARAMARGQKVTNPDPSLVIFLKCKEFNCLPNKGGLFDQDPEILEAFDIIQGEIDKVQSEEARKQEMEMKKTRRRR